MLKTDGRRRSLKTRECGHLVMRVWRHLASTYENFFDRDNVSSGWQTNIGLSVWINARRTGVVDLFCSRDLDP